MHVNVNCKHNDGGPYCKNHLVKRSFFGLGPRMCPLFNAILADCPQQLKSERPNTLPVGHR